MLYFFLKKGKRTRVRRCGGDMRKRHWLCGCVACAVFWHVARTRHPISACSAVGAVLRHIAFPSSRVALGVDLVCNALTFVTIVPLVPFWCAVAASTAAVNFALFYHKRSTEMEHLLQVTVPCGCMAMMAPSL